MPIEHSPINTGTAAVSRTNRAAITNGSKWLSGVDMRSAQARRFKDLVRAFTADLGGNLSTAETAMVRQAAALTVRAEAIQAELVRGDKVSDEELVRITNAVQRILGELGVQQRKNEAEAANRLQAFQNNRRKA
jgi:trimethylamine:corrinoid methyltransferase-like protein